MSASAEPPWDDATSKTQINASLDSTALRSTLLDTGPAEAMGGTCSLQEGTVPAPGVPSGLRCPVHAGVPGGPLARGQRAPRAAPRAHMARPGGAPRRCQGGREFIPRAASRELPFGSARAAAGGGAALRRAALQPGPGRGRWMPRLRFCSLPGGLRRPVSTVRRGRRLGDGPGPVGWPGGLRPGRRAGGGARRLLLPHCPLEAAARTPGSGPRLRGGARRPGTGNRPGEAGRGALAPLVGSGARGGRAGWP